MSLEAAAEGEATDDSEAALERVTGARSPELLARILRDGVGARARERERAAAAEQLSPAEMCCCMQATASLARCDFSERTMRSQAGWSQPCSAGPSIESHDGKKPSSSLQALGSVPLPG